jgi:uncharacterized protein (TIGR00369 family)
MLMSDDDFRHDVADRVLKLPVVEAFGLEFTELGHGRAVARVGWRPQHSHTPGAFQASPVAALCDFTGAAAGMTLLPPGSSAATIDYTAKFIKEARGEQLVARARTYRAGTTLSVAEVSAYAGTGEDETLCAVALVTIRNFIAHGTEPVE